MKWIEFDKASGWIRQSVEGSAVTPPGETDAVGVLMDASAVSTDSWVNPATGQLEARPESSGTCESNGSGVTFSGFPVGAVISGAGLSLIVTDSNAITHVLDPGSYVFEVRQFPVKAARFEITI